MDYLLDTNICVAHLRNKLDITDYVSSEESALLISDITVAELKYGVQNADPTYRLHNQHALTNFLDFVPSLPIYDALEVYAKEKARLRKIGQPIDDFDLLIGATAVVYNLTLVTNNTRHFARIQGIRLEDWTKE